MKQEQNFGSDYNNNALSSTSFSPSIKILIHEIKKGKMKEGSVWSTGRRGNYNNCGKGNVQKKIKRMSFFRKFHISFQTEIEIKLMKVHHLMRTNDPTNCITVLPDSTFPFHSFRWMPRMEKKLFFLKFNIPKRLDLLGIFLLL